MTNHKKVAAVALLMGLGACGATKCEAPTTTTTTKTAIIGSSPVPEGLECAEDELIGYVQEGPAPYELGCIHSETFTGYR